MADACVAEVHADLKGLYADKWWERGSAELEAVLEQVGSVFEHAFEGLRQQACAGQLVRLAIKKLCNEYVAAIVEGRVLDKAGENDVAADDLEARIEGDMAVLQGNFEEYEGLVTSAAISHALEALDLLRQLLTCEDGFFSVHFEPLCRRFDNTGQRAGGVLEAALHCRPDLNKKQRADIVADLSAKHPDHAPLHTGIFNKMSSRLEVAVSKPNKPNNSTEAPSRFQRLFRRKKE